jgi:NADH-quinone oxidoreductase subunit A
MLANYFPVLIFILIGVFIGFFPLLASRVLIPKYPDIQKNSPYECGFDGVNDARMPFDVRYYLVALLFIIFDLETAFLFPWAVVLRHIGWYGLIAMLIFLSILIIGFIYEWKKGALEWE